MRTVCAVLLFDAGAARRICGAFNGRARKKQTSRNCFFGRTKK
jgi:hypothetical protein